MGCRAGGTLNSESLVITTLEWADRDWGSHKCTFPDYGLACAAVLGKARGAGSHEDRRTCSSEYRLDEFESKSILDFRPEADVRSKPNAVNAGPEPDAGSEPDAGPKPNEINAGPEPDARPKPNEINARPEPNTINAGLIGKCKKYESKGTVLSMDGGSRLKGVNSLKSSEDLWGPVRWHSRLDPFPYSEPLTNLASYFGARGISDKALKASMICNACVK
ncbi:hypothetical protein CDL15_Pgr012470 [Punica granatum]|uniref:Uncharacterized protein n=1 Tax=Punica granatum TaxID=22663 RepID=A0A218WYX8_PUNGR|nr:hypothetical protein CDL15_Pgr012470 [Punica granatum]